ncbi:MAG: DUF1700 domain-containing protein [Oribacterium sp.]
MTREEFLRALRAELSNSVSEERIREQLSYYQDYIASECKKGRSEEEVVSELGEPRLLAKTIADAAEAGGDRIARETPFRHEESEINYNSDEEDRQYRGIDSGLEQNLPVVKLPFDQLRAVDEADPLPDMIQSHIVRIGQAPEQKLVVGLRILIALLRKFLIRIQDGGEGL